MGPKSAAQKNTAQAIARIEKLNPILHAVIAVDPTAMQQAQALSDEPSEQEILHGMPILIKDNIETKGPMPTTAGSLALLPNITERDAQCVARLRAAGAIILGKANLSEWAVPANAPHKNWSAVGGAVRNPHRLDADPGISSSGSAVAVASGMVDMALGTEVSGSIVFPAANNGVVGLKPTVGLISRSHLISWCLSQDTPGPLAKDVRTAAMALTVMAGTDPDDAATRNADTYKSRYHTNLAHDALRGCRIGVLRYAHNKDAAARQAFNRALGVLRAQGATLIEVRYPSYGPDFKAAKSFVKNTEGKTALDAYLKSTPSSVRPRSLADLLAFNEAHPKEITHCGQQALRDMQNTQGTEAPSYQEIRARTFRLTGPDGIDALLTKDDLRALVSPTIQDAWVIAATAGYPHLTVPMGRADGLPVGLSFIGAAWHDQDLLSLGFSFEQAARVCVQPAYGMRPLARG
jgi:amidase